MTTDAPAETRQPFHFRCKPCGHVWPPVYLPMPAATFGAVVKAARCPICGSTSAQHFIADEGDVARSMEKRHG